MSSVQVLVQALRRPIYGWRRLSRDIAVDVAILVLSLLAAHWLTFPRSLAFEFGSGIVIESVALSLACVVLLLWRGAYSVNPRYFGLGDFMSINLSVLLLVLFQFCLPVSADGDVKRSIARGLLFGGLLTAGLSSVRIVQRLRSWQRNRQSEVKIRRTLIIGAGDAAEMIMREIKRSSHTVHRVVGFVDDAPDKQSSLIHQVPVLGTTEQIPDLVKDHDIEELLIALPSAKGEDMRRITQLCQSTDARVRTLPPVKTLLTGGPQIFSHLREVDIEDLLRREPVQTDLESIAKYISGERVLITGGGGSIGSELARQIASLSPANLILLGKGENSVYEIEQELLQTNRFQPSCIIADVRDKASMEAAFEKFRPTVVFHAAAHKHVPLMQGNPIEAIRNNILGTWQTADLAIKYGAKRFINVSTDKAVKPSSVMGATKRVGEMIVTSMGRRSETEFAIVRFGNVMGSRGSLIPLLKAQIKRGGPVRVTHPEMTRYFMTIPEAVQLILQAGAIGERGEIFILDMGDPIKILDLAMDLIRLHGLVPGEDIEVQFTGVRPGEKLYEELLYDTETLSKTSHPKIRMVEEPATMPWDMLRTELQNLLEICAEGKPEEARHTLMELAWGKSVLGSLPLNQPSRAVVDKTEN